MHNDTKTEHTKHKDNKYAWQDNVGKIQNAGNYSNTQI